MVMVASALIRTAITKVLYTKYEVVLLLRICSQFSKKSCTWTEYLNGTFVEYVSVKELASAIDYLRKFRTADGIF